MAIMMTVTLALLAGAGLSFFTFPVALWSSDSSPGQYVFFFGCDPPVPSGMLLLSCYDQTINI